MGRRLVKYPVPPKKERSRMVCVGRRGDFKSKLCKHHHGLALTSPILLVQKKRKKRKKLKKSQIPCKTSSSSSLW
jgi:hypothetical protein